MADLKLDVDISAILRADKALKDFEGRFNQLEQAARRGVTSQDKLVTVFNRLDKAGLSLSQVYRSMEKDLDNNAKTAARLENEFRNLSLSGKSARESARAMEQAFRQQEQAAEEVARATRQQAQAVEQSANSYRQLRASIDPAYRAQQQLLQSKRVIRQQLQQNNITMEQAVALMRQYRQAQVASNTAVIGSTRGINGMGMVMQQTGYQVGDFLVQVQGGTNFMVAFGQQATQLVGILPMLGAGFMGLSMRSLVALSAGLGIAIPLVTAIGAAFMRTRGAAEDAADGIQTLSNRIQSARQQISDMTFEIEAMRRGFEDFREFALIQAVEEAQNRVQELGQQIYDLQQLGTVTGPNERELALAQEALQLAQEQLETYQRSREEHEGLTASMEQGVSFSERLLTAYETIRNVMGEAGDEFKQGLVDQADALAQKVAVAEAEVRQAAEEGRILKEQMAEAKREAELLAAIDIKSGVDAAASSAAQLARSLGVSVSAASALMAMGGGREQEVIFDPRDPRYDRNRAMMAQVQGDTVYRDSWSPDVVDTGGSAGGGGGGQPGIGGFAQSLLTEMEQVELFRENALEQLENFNAMELEILGGHSEARLRIEEEYQNRLRQLEQNQQSQRLGDVAGFFGAMASVAQSGGDKMVRVASAFSAAQALINSYTAYTEMLKDPAFIGRPFARFAAAASVLGAGLKMVSAIKGVGGGGGSGGGVSAPGMVDPIGSSGAASPQRVIIEGIDRDTLISGEQLSRLFDKLYEENNERGVVFSVAR